MNNKFNPATSQLLHLSQISRKIQVMNVPERQIVLQDIQDQIGAMMNLYRAHTLTFKALSVAYEAIRLTWYALGADEDGCREKLEYLDAAVQRLAEHLLKPINEPTINDYEIAYPSQFCDCGCTNEFGGPTGAACVGWRDEPEFGEAFCQAFDIDS